MKKGPEAVGSLERVYDACKAEIQSFYHKLAIKTMFWSYDYEVAATLVKFHFPANAPLPSEEILRDGLVFEEGGMSNTLYSFVHRTFAEFFVADFVSNIIFFHEDCTDEVLKLTIGVFIQIIIKAATDYKIIKVLSLSLSLSLLLLLVSNLNIFKTTTKYEIYQKTFFFLY
jgi:hypothetical protein